MYFHGEQILDIKSTCTVSVQYSLGKGDTIHSKSHLFQRYICTFTYYHVTYIHTEPLMFVYVNVYMMHLLYTHAAGGCGGRPECW